MDPTPPDDFIDVIVVDLLLEANNSRRESNVTGINGIAMISLQFEAQCTQGFTGDFCTDTGEGGLRLALEIGASTLLLVLLLAILTVLCFIVKKQRKAKKSRRSDLDSVQDQHYAPLVRAG